MSTRERITFAAGAASILALFVFDLMTGSISIPFKEVLRALFGIGTDPANARIINGIRLTKAIVAVIAGASLSVSGLMMQTMFRNPLAGPSVLGITSGASLGVAMFLIGAPLVGWLSEEFIHTVGIAGAACIGAALTMLLIIASGRKVNDIMVILILGMMFSSGVSAIVQVLQYISNESALKSFVMWTMGSLGDVTSGQLTLLIPAFAAGMGLSVAVIKPLNLLLLGENYAKTMGLNVNRSRFMIFLSTTILAGTVTAFCGPIGFIGLAVPHIARFVFSSQDHRILLPGTIICGIIMMLLCDIISKITALPINTVTSLFGIPVIILVVFKNKRMA